MIEFHIYKSISNRFNVIGMRKNKKIVSSNDDKLSIYGVYSIKNE